MVGKAGWLTEVHLIGSRDWENCVSKQARAKSLPDPVLVNKMGVVGHVCDASYMGSYK
jgi:hypothetical protein